MQVVRIIPEPYGPEGLLAATGDEWRDKRHSLTPAFSAAKMKMVQSKTRYACHCCEEHIIVQMVPLVKKSADSLVDKFREKAESGESIEVMRCILTTNISKLND